MLSLKTTFAATAPVTRTTRAPSRRRTVSVAARTRDEKEEEFRAQQELLAFRKAKLNSPEHDALAEKGRPTAPKGSQPLTSSVAPTKVPKTAEDEAKRRMNRPDADDEARTPKAAQQATNSPIDSLLGKLFGRK
jgi:hypothetical protein